MAALPHHLRKLSTNESFVHYDDHSQPHRGTTLPQLTLFVVWVAAIILWVMGRANKANLLPKFWTVTADHGADETAAAEDGASTKLLPSSDGLVAVTVNGVVPTNATADPRQDGEGSGAQEAPTGDGDGSSDQRATTTNSTSRESGSGNGTTTKELATETIKQNFSAVIPPPSTEKFLQQIILLGVIMIYFYLCDYRKVSNY